MDLTTMFLINIAMGLTAMALACVICVTMEKAVAAGKKALVLANGYCKAHFHHAWD